MEVENFFSSSYDGSKRFTQQDVKMANATGFGAAADDYMERGIDLNEQLVHNKPATFFMRMGGNNMVNAGIGEGDILIVDRSVKPTHGRIIIAVVDGEMLVRRYEKTMNKLLLISEGKQRSSIDVSEFTDFKVWGVVVYVIRAL